MEMVFCYHIPVYCGIGVNVFGDVPINALSASVIKCKNVPNKKCREIAERRKK